MSCGMKKSCGTSNTSIWKWTLFLALVMGTAVHFHNAGSLNPFKTHYIEQGMTHYPLPKYVPVDSNPCPVLSCMTKGNWRPWNISEQQDHDILKFLAHVHTKRLLPSNYQRKDGLCGNVTHVGGHGQRNYRALCDPKGPTPCCYHNRCTMKSVEECDCKDCYDVRQMKHGEYSTWIPSQPQCPYKSHSPEEACQILNGSTLVFIGDSYIRHIFTAMSLITTGDEERGAMVESAKEDEKKVCEGMYMFTDPNCRLILKNHTLMCGGRTPISNYYYPNIGFLNRVKSVINPLVNNSLVVLGIGIHEGFNVKRIQDRYLKFIFDYTNALQRQWPKYLWAETHAPGLLKSPIYMAQTYSKVKTYNAQMKPFLGKWNIPIFETFNLTDGMVSYDGGHYGMGVNLVKANILLSYIQELRKREKW